MEYTLHKSFAEIPASAWNALAEAGISDTPFSRHEMLSAWWQTLGGGEWQQAELVLVSASEDGRLVGIAPLFKAEYDGRMALLLVGSIEVSDYLDLIVRLEDLPRFLSGLLDFLGQSGPCGGLPFDWYNLPDSSPTLAALQAEAEKRGCSYRQEIYRPTPRISLEGGFDAYLARIDKKQRHEIRRKMRRAAESQLPQEFRIVDERSSLDADIESFFELMSHDTNKAGFLKPAMRAHVGSLMRIAFDNGYLWLAFLSINGIKAAAALNFDYKNKLWGYNSGVSRDFMELSPGWLMLTHEIQWASEHGRYEFDFMRGDEDYKYRFGGVNKYVMRAVVSASQR
jgi:CelD/BcsL family acetyltransferase involved in cellulose biosynthesis